MNAFDDTSSSTSAGVSTEGEAVGMPTAAVAARFAAMFGPGLPNPALIVASDERRAEEIWRALTQLAPDLDVWTLPGWDCLPYDRAAPSREVMGRRMAMLAHLAGETPETLVLVASPEALIQRLPPPEALAPGMFTLRLGDRLDREALRSWTAKVGYVEHDQVGEPGDVTFRGEVLDVFPAHAAAPVRAGLDAEDRIVELHAFDPATQRTVQALDSAVLGLATELIVDDEAGAAAHGSEHRLPAAYASLRTVFDLAPFDPVFAEAGAASRGRALIDQVEDAWRTQRDFAEGEAPLPSDALYLSVPEFERRLGDTRLVQPSSDGIEPAPSIASARSPGAALAAFVREHGEAGRRVILTGQAEERRGLARAVQRGLGREPERAESWAAAIAAPPGAVMLLDLDLDAGFVDTAAGLALLTAADVYGDRLARRRPNEGSLLATPELAVGDVVIHEDHGVGVLRALERVAVNGVERDVLRLEYYGGADVLAPVEEFGRVWRYGAEAGAVALDRLKGDGWARRRAEASRQIDGDARRLVEQARLREATTTDPIAAPKTAYTRFAARFPFPETPDQKDAIAAVLADLASGRPMNRLVCGDVGFGKTEVALRAAAAVALSGRQVAIAAPTTVLARQHFAGFQQRFAGTGVKVAQLSRLVSTAEARAVKAGLASGEIGVVVGTHALAGQDVAFRDLALMVLDEEQKFGAKMKAELHAAAPHLLTLTATPIPRTLQAAMVGVQDVSVIATSPARRRPIRTFLAPFDPATMRTALLREKRRGGQSFVVTPRIADLRELAERLAELTPELQVVVAHGELSSEAVDEAMVGFADGRGDVLLATDIIESGLDVPRANTMLVWNADQFGLAQLHQLRGRVGRGRTQGVAYLFTAPEHAIAEATRARLSMLETLDRLGAGLAISSRDLDLRGGGDLLGDEQAGHMKLIGAALYQQLMQRAVRLARSEVVEPHWTPELHLDEPAALTPDYIPDAVTRINLYARLARLASGAEVDAFAEELDDRFGPRPPEAAALITAARIQELARAAGVRRVTAGPLAVALELDPTAASRALALANAGGPGLKWSDPRLIYTTSETGQKRLAEVAGLLEALASG